MSIKFASSAPAWTLGISNTGIVGEQLYKQQASHLSNALLMDDYDPQVEVDTHKFFTYCSLKFPVGSLISGSFLMKKVADMISVSKPFDAEDIDIYFKCKQDAIDFALKNNMTFINFDSSVCAYGKYYSDKVNLIYGIPYKNGADLISKFDIRACAMACDPNADEIYIVKDAIRDLVNSEICFNPVPRSVSLRRFAKYIKKGFHCDDPHQRLFFAELIRSNIYSTELELITGY